MGVIRKKSRKGNGLTLSEEDRARLEDRIKATQIEHVSIASLKPNPKNAKQHPQKQIELLAANILQFGMTQPLVVDENDVVLCGHGRLQACKLAGLSTVLVVRLTHLSPPEKKALALADNKLAELGTWDFEILAEDLKELSNPELDMGFDFEITGFDTVDVDALTAPEKKEKEDPADLLPEVIADCPAVTKPGDLWVMGQHRLLCGDARSAESYRTLLQEERADLVFTDPPYNVPIAGNVTKRADVREFPMASGEMTEAEYIAFLRATLSHMADFAQPGAVVYVCIDHKHFVELSVAATPIFGRQKNLAVWVKSNAGMGSFYRPQHELVAIFVKTGAGSDQQFRIGRARSRPYQCLELSGAEWFWAGTRRTIGHASHREAGRDGRGRNSRLLES